VCDTYAVSAAVAAAVAAAAATSTAAVTAAVAPATHSGGLQLCQHASPHLLIRLHTPCCHGVTVERRAKCHAGRREPQAYGTSTS
jgi:hypothetical protein